MIFIYSVVHHISNNDVVDRNRHKFEGKADTAEDRETGSSRKSCLLDHFDARKGTIPQDTLAVIDELLSGSVYQIDCLHCWLMRLRKFVWPKSA